MFKVLIVTLLLTVLFTGAFWYHEKFTKAGLKQALKYIAAPCLVASVVLSVIVSFF